MTMLTGSVHVGDKDRRTTVVAAIGVDRRRADAVAPPSQIDLHHGAIARCLDIGICRIDVARGVRVRYIEDVRLRDIAHQR